MYWQMHGRFIARHPLKAILVSLICTGCCGLGIMKLEIETVPEKLWVAPTSRAAADKTFFDDHFGMYFQERITLVLAAEGSDSPA